MRYSRRSAAALTIVGLVIYLGSERLPDAAVWALPEYTQKEGKSCAYCHFAPSGAGARNYRGEFYRKNAYLFAGFDDAAEAARAGEAVGPDAVPPPKSWTSPKKRGEFISASPTSLPIPVAAARVKAAKAAYDRTRTPTAKKAYAAALGALGKAIAERGKPEERRAAALNLYRRALVLDPQNSSLRLGTKNAARATEPKNPVVVAPGEMASKASLGTAELPVPEEPVDAKRVLQEMALRWRSAVTFEYRSRSVMDHAGEARVTLDKYARFLRPNKARIVFDGNMPEASRTRVSDGLLVYDRMASAPLRPARTLRAAYRGQLTENISHPLDVGSYSTEQFFSASPFLPAASWGESGHVRKYAAVRMALLLPGEQKKRRVYRITIRQGVFEDVLVVDALNFSPIRLTRFGLHAGIAQELLAETFTDVRLGSALDASLFCWTKYDEAR